MQETQRKNLRLIARAAVASAQATGCPAELQAAQCILETGWLSHAPGNNCFGIKSYPGEFGRQLLRSREWFTDGELRQFLTAADGRTAELVVPARQDARGHKLYLVQDWFATFATLGDCFARRAAFFNQGRYAQYAAAWRANRDLDALVRGVASVYATDPGYSNRLFDLIRDAEVQAALDEARAAAAAPAEVAK